MDTPQLILVTGAPATGKTTIAQELTSLFKLPLISKDVIKETIFDTLGWSDREWSRKAGVATYQIMYYILESHLAAQKSLIMESDFRPEWDEPKLLALKEKFPFTSLVIHCQADADVILERFKARVTAGTRHPGHVDTENYDRFTPERLRKEFPTLTLGGAQLAVDTTDFKKVDYEGIWRNVASFLETGRVVL